MDSASGELLKREGASAAAHGIFRRLRLRAASRLGRGDQKAAGHRCRLEETVPLKGGNQLMTDAFAARLGNRVHLGCPVLRIDHSATGATVTYREFEQERKLEADYMVSCVSLVVLRQIPVSPAWTEAKAFVIREMPYYTRCRVVFQSRTRFWKADKVSPNWSPTDPRLNELWSMADEVNTPRGILLGGAQAGVRRRLARRLPQAVPWTIGGHRASHRTRLVERSVRRYVRANQLQAWRTFAVLAGSDPSRGPHPFRRGLCAQMTWGRKRRSNPPTAPPGKSIRPDGAFEARVG